VTAQSGGIQPLVVATFGASTAWCGKTIVFSDGVFFLEDHGPIQAADVLTYDEQGHLGWAYDGLRDWVAQCANDTAAVPAKPVAGDGDQILVFDSLAKAHFRRPDTTPEQVTHASPGSDQAEPCRHVALVQRSKTR
jgi:hypothetical protein